MFFFFKQKTAYEIKECDWSSDVCSSDLSTGFQVRRWDTDSGQLRGGLTIEQEPFNVLSSPDGRILAVTTSDRILIWDMTSGERLPDLSSKEWDPTIVFSPDSTTLVIGYRDDRPAELWSVRPVRLLRELPAKGRSIAFSFDGSALAIGSTGEVVICDPQTGRTLKVLPAPGRNPFLAVAWSPNGETLAGGCGVLLQCWDISSGESICTFGSLDLFPGLISSLCWLDPTTLVAGCAFGVRVCDIESKKVIRTIPGHFQDWRHQPCAFSPDRRLVAFPGQGLIRLRRLADGRLLRTILSLRDNQWAVLSPDGHYRGSPGVQKELVYVVQTDAGQETLTPAEFARKYGWKNDPKRVRPGNKDPPRIIQEPH